MTTTTAPTATLTTTHLTGGTLVDRMRADWDLDCAQVTLPAHLAQLAGLQTDGSTYGDLLKRMGADSATAERMLGELVHQHHQGCHLAGRTVLQAMLPKAMRLYATARGRRMHDPQMSVITALWETIATYPIQRRQGTVAGGLALDTLKALCKESPREAPQEVPAGDFGLEDPFYSSGSHVEVLAARQRDTTPDPTHDVVDLLRWAQDSGALRDSEIQVLALRHLAADTSWDAVADRLGIEREAARKRHGRARRALIAAVKTSLEADTEPWTDYLATHTA